MDFFQNKTITHIHTLCWCICTFNTCVCMRTYVNVWDNWSSMFVRYIMRNKDNSYFFFFLSFWFSALNFPNCKDIQFRQGFLTSTVSKLIFTAGGWDAHFWSSHFLPLATPNNSKNWRPFLCPEQGCQIFLVLTYQKYSKKTTNYSKWSQNIPIAHEIYQVSIKFNKIILLQAFQNISKLGFLVWKYTIWQPWSRAATAGASQFVRMIRSPKAAVLNRFVHMLFEKNCFRRKNAARNYFWKNTYMANRFTTKRFKTNWFGLI
jgi:hypothetical protein